MKKLRLIILFTMVSGLLCACGKPSTSEGKQETTNITKENSTSASTSNTNLDSSLGEWICVAECYDNELTLSEDIGHRSELKVYTEDNKYKVDFFQYFEESSLEIYGKSITEINDKLYDDCTNQEWYADIRSTQEENYTQSYQMTLLDNDTLELLYTYTYNGDDETSTYYTHYYYKKADSDIEKAIYDYRYPEEITVSNVKEFYNALGSNRKIIMKAGTYNISELSEDDKNNDHVNWRYDCIYDSSYEDGYYWDYAYFPEAQAYCNEIRNLIIEGEEGAEVHICTEEPTVAPLAFGNCSHITLKNLKVGHMVEPGMCCGSVVYYNYSNNINIENCRLYGCGTYGVEAKGSNNLNVTSCDIYECSYGLVSLQDCYSANFDNCTLRDSSDLSMFYLASSSSVRFSNCTITGNDSTSSEYTRFIDAESSYGDITFDKCTFKNNIYNNLYSGEVTFTDCQMN